MFSPGKKPVGAEIANPAGLFAGTSDSGRLDSSTNRAIGRLRLLEFFNKNPRFLPIQSLAVCARETADSPLASQALLLVSAISAHRGCLPDINGEELRRVLRSRRHQGSLTMLTVLQDLAGQSASVDLELVPVSLIQRAQAASWQPADPADRRGGRRARLPPWFRPGPLRGGAAETSRGVQHSAPDPLQVLVVVSPRPGRGNGRLVC